MRERVDMCPSLFTVSPLKLLFYICAISARDKSITSITCTMHKSQIYFANVEMYYCMLLKKLNYSTHIKSSKSVDIGTCLALWDDFEKNCRIKQ